MDAPQLLYPLDEVLHRIGGLSKTWIYVAMAKGEFPAPVKVGRRSVWRHTDLVEWEGRLMPADHGTL